jgi:hypothetical protein
MRVMLVKLFDFLPIVRYSTAVCNFTLPSAMREPFANGLFIHRVAEIILRIVFHPVVHRIDPVSPVVSGSTPACDFMCPSAIREPLASCLSIHRAAAIMLSIVFHPVLNQIDFRTRQPHFPFPSSFSFAFLCRTSV